MLGHRLIVSSSVYRQSSAARPELKEKDPRNLLLARQERVRVQAEVVRDAARLALIGAAELAFAQLLADPLDTPPSRSP